MLRLNTFDAQDHHQNLKYTNIMRVNDDVERRKYLISSFSSIDIVILLEFAKDDI